MPKPHPLRAWFDAKGIGVREFSAEHGISFRALYSQIEGVSDPRLSTLLAIEKATNKCIRVQDIAAWFRNRN